MIYFDKQHIQDLLPQRDPIVMVDAIWAEDANHACTELAVRADNFFLDGGKLLEAGIIEHIAQSAAAMVGARNIGEAARHGYIGELKNIRIGRLPELGDMLQTQVSTIAEAAGISLVEATVRIGEELAAEGQMKVFVEDK